MIALNSLLITLIEFAKTGIQIVLGLASGVVVGLLYAGWVIAPVGVKATFAALFNMAVGYEPAEVLQADEPKTPRVYYEEYEADGELVKIDYMEIVDGQPYISRQSLTTGNRGLRS